MGDFRYKITGTSEPYNIRLYCCDNTEIIDFEGNHTYYDNYISGFTSDLEAGGCYYITVTDYIGKTIQSNCFLIPEDYNVYNPPTVDFWLGGSIENSDTNDHYIREDGTNKLNIDSFSTTGQSVDVTFYISACTNTNADDGCNNTAYVELYCNGNTNVDWCVTADYYHLTSANTITMTSVKSSDTITYKAHALIDPPQNNYRYCTEAYVGLTNVITSGSDEITPHLIPPLSICVPNTGMEEEPELHDVSIFLEKTDCDETSNSIHECGRLVIESETYPPLGAGESVDVEINVIGFVETLSEYSDPSIGEACSCAHSISGDSYNLIINGDDQDYYDNTFIINIDGNTQSTDLEYDMFVLINYDESCPGTNSVDASSELCIIGVTGHNVTANLLDQDNTFVCGCEKYINCFCEWNP